MAEKIILASPRGFCAGVSRAILIVEKALEKYGSPVFVRHEIVHNAHVVDSLKDKGAVFVETVEEVPEGSVIIFSAHGVPPEIYDKASKQGLKVIDATCPLVKKVHLEAERFHKEGCDIILIGKKGHQEIIGTMGYAPMHLISKVEDIQDLNISNPKIAFLTQTTLSIDDSKEMIDALKERFPDIRSSAKEDICYATTNRQKAVKELTKYCDLVIVVGSEKSSNSNKLRDTAEKQGIMSYLIPDKSHIDPDWFTNTTAIGITSGASVPEVLVEEVIEEIGAMIPDIKVETLDTVKEDVEFSLPEL